MATVTIYPNGDGSKGSGWSDAASGTTNLYQSIDEGTASPNDSDYVSCNSAGSSIFFLLDNMPGDFGTLTSYEIKLRCSRSSNKGDYRYLTSCQLFKSDETTAIASSHTITSTTTETTFTFSTSPSYTDKTSWDGARLKVTMAGTGSTGSGRVQALQIDLVYSGSSTTYNETGSGGALGGGTSSVYRIASITSVIGAICGGVGFASDGNSEYGVGGGRIGGLALVSRLFAKSTSGGAVCSGVSTESELPGELKYQVSLNGLVVPSVGETSLILDMVHTMAERETITMHLFSNYLDPESTDFANITLAELTEVVHAEYEPVEVEGWGASVTDGDGAIITADSITWGGWGDFDDSATTIAGWWLQGESTGAIYAVNTFEDFFYITMVAQLEIHPIIYLQGKI